MDSDNNLDESMHLALLFAWNQVYWCNKQQSQVGATKQQVVGHIGSKNCKFGLPQRGIWTTSISRWRASVSCKIAIVVIACWLILIQFYLLLLPFHQDSIPTDIGLLSNLTCLRLSYNIFTGNVLSYRSLQDLTLIHFHGNMLSGTIPPNTFFEDTGFYFWLWKSLWLQTIPWLHYLL